MKENKGDCRAAKETHTKANCIVSSNKGVVRPDRDMWRVDLCSNLRNLEKVENGHSSCTVVSLATSDPIGDCIA